MKKCSKSFLEHEKKGMFSGPIMLEAVLRSMCVKK
jgi:hypothetical protein